MPGVKCHASGDIAVQHILGIKRIVVKVFDDIFLIPGAVIVQISRQDVEALKLSGKCDRPG